MSKIWRAMVSRVKTLAQQLPAPTSSLRYTSHPSRAEMPSEYKSGVLCHRDVGVTSISPSGSASQNVNKLHMHKTIVLCSFVHATLRASNGIGR